MNGNSRLKTKFILAFLFCAVTIGLYLLRLPGGLFISAAKESIPVAYHFQLFLWLASLLYAYISVHVFAVRNFWVLTFFPAVVPVVMIALLSTIQVLVTNNWTLLTENRDSTILIAAGASGAFGIVYWLMKKQFRLKLFFSADVFLEYLTQYKSRIESVHKIILEAVSFGSIIIFFIKLFFHANGI